MMQSWEWGNHTMDHFPFLPIKLKFQWAILSKFNFSCQWAIFL